MNRYERQIAFPPFGVASEKKLRKASVVICGCGGLGCTLAMWLARSGVGKIRLIDHDSVSLSNIHRQILFAEEDENRQKVLAAVEHLRKVASSTQYEPVCEKIGADNRESLVSGFDLMLDATDNYATRFHLNRAAIRNSLPWIHAGVAGAQGQVFSIVPGETPCLECLFPNLARIAAGECSEPDKPAGILGPAVGMIASFQALEAMKFLSGNRDCVHTALVTFDFWRNRIKEIDLAPLKKADCICQQ
ncbi:MAG: HesA/MoeB/ThiF family protein [Planctomycetia bacterium]|nr:HesA/MoeB/ThiF family protein [Planctomycetia bacterium]